SLLNALDSAVGQTGQGNSHSVISTELEKFLHVRSHTLVVLGATATAYAVVEGVEAVGLWFERRWAEYLTAVATAGFLPFEVHELINRVTVFRVGALVVNIAVLVYLVIAKHLFGIGGPPKAADDVDRHALFGPAALRQ